MKKSRIVAQACELVLLALEYRSTCNRAAARMCAGLDELRIGKKSSNVTLSRSYELRAVMYRELWKGEEKLAEVLMAAVGPNHIVKTYGAGSARGTSPARGRALAAA
jgi:hypothetical protein